MTLPRMPLLPRSAYLCLALSCALLAPLAHAAENNGEGAFNLPGFDSAASSVNPDNSDKRSPNAIRNPRSARQFDGPLPGTDSIRNNEWPNQNGRSEVGMRGGAPQFVNKRPALPVEPLGEFQKFVESATGRQLPIFGSQFFSDAADAFAPVDNVPVTADYIVGTGDELNIRAWGSIDVDYRAVVNRNGQINLPRVGSFTVAGVKASELEKHLRSQIARLFTNFQLNVTLGQLRGAKVFVVGPARVPGVYTLSSQATLLSAIVAARGPSNTGSMRKVLLRRDGRVISELDLYEFLVQGDKSKDVQLVSGDVVVFVSRGARVALSGAIDTPAIYELKSPQEPLRDVLQYAGGAPVLSNPHRVQVERVDTSTTKAARLVEGFKLSQEELQKPLRDGDIVTLLPISPEFANAVTLKGHVAQPLRYAHTAGMRIRDLIPDKEALVSPDFYRRKNLLVQVQPLDEEETTRRKRLDPEREPSTRSNASEREATRNPVTERKKNLPTGLFDELNWDYAVIERLNPTDLSTQIIPFNLGKAVLQGDPQHNRELFSGDVVTIYSQKDIRVPVGRQTRLVVLEGEVGAPGVYQTQAGETLPQLLLRAGGLTPQAYVYGLELSREETRQRQRENIAEAIVRLEALSSAQTARDAANKQVDQRDSTSVASAAATQAQISRLTRLQPNGRIALELPPEAESIDALPSVPLENADRIVVPTRPGFITVAGAVVSSNALLWRQDRSVSQYIDLAGLDEAAEPAHMFVLRADGTVITNAQRSGWLGMGGLKGMRLSPGDTVVIPNKLDYETWGHALVRNLKDWSQIFSQFGLGAAAIQSLRRN
jgi:polysaccharide biosynthesis/export protein